MVGSIGLLFVTDFVLLAAGCGGSSKVRSMPSLGLADHNKFTARYKEAAACRRKRFDRILAAIASQ